MAQTKERHREYMKIRLSDPEILKKRRTSSRDKRTNKRKKLGKWLYEYRTTLKCEQCGEDDSICLEFHHKRETSKKSAVQKMINKMATKEEILEEISKCEVLCSNCHRKKHKDRFKYWSPKN